MEFRMHLKRNHLSPFSFSLVHQEPIHRFRAFVYGILAKGIELAGCGSAGLGKGGRKLSYKAVIQGNGNLLLGKANTAMLDLQPGDEFEIRLSNKKGVTLVPMGAENEEGED